jgi:hypothetical protein
VKSSYTNLASAPTFYGIAFANSKVTLKLTKKNCTADCVKTYSTVANPESRFGINVPAGDLDSQNYTTNLSVSLDNNYNELPEFTLVRAGNTLSEK